MKKSLLALAALTAFAGAASAQSSVTLFGVVDLSVGQVDNGAADRFLMMQDGNASTRLGFRGVEDLGGGLKAGFWLESALAPDSQAAPTFGRRTTLSLMGGWGEVRLGRDYTPTFWNWTRFDPFGTNGVGSSTNLALEVNTVPGGNFGTLVRADNTVGYHLPSGLGGFYGQAMVSLGEGVAGNKIYAGLLGWAAGPFNVAGSYGITEASFSQDMTNWNIAGSWNLGFMTLSGFYGNLELDASATASRPFDQDNWFVGASVPMGAFTFKGTYGSVERDSNGGACYNPGANVPAAGNPLVTSCDANQWALGVVYDLSKRTAVYGTYSSIDNSGTIFRTFGGTNALGNRTDTNTGWQIGVRHSF